MDWSALIESSVLSSLPKFALKASRAAETLLTGKKKEVTTGRPESYGELNVGFAVDVQLYFRYRSFYMFSVLVHMDLQFFIVLWAPEHKFSHLNPYISIYLLFN